MPAAFAQTSDPSLINRGFGPFERSLNDKCYGYNLITPQNFPHPAPSQIPNYYERFEVRAGDCGAHSNWDDCQNDRERSELSEKGSRNPLGSEYIYEWDFYAPAHFADLHPTKTIITQFHQEGGSPVWVFTFQNGLYLERRIGGQIQQKILLLTVQQMREQWHHVKIHAAWETSQNGFFSLWINGTQKLNYQGPTMSAQKVYMKYGIYRAYISRYLQLHNVTALPTQILFFANMKRSLPPQNN